MNKKERYIPLRMEQQIRKVLCLRSQHDLLPRCPAKNVKHARRLADQGDTIHVRLDHAACDLCRCTHVAGWGTKGRFWSDSPEWEQYGHYGVGWCAIHGNGPKRKFRDLEFAIAHMKAIQQHGRAMTVSQDYEQIMKQEAEEARDAQETVENILELQSYLREFREKFKDPDANLTERGGKDGDIQMTDATKARLLVEMSKAVSSMAKDRFYLNSLDYISVDQLKIRIPLMYGLVTRLFGKLREMVIKGEPDAVEKVRVEFREEFKEIWSNLKRGVKKG
jgi:hypothetical protein